MVLHGDFPLFSGRNGPSHPQRYLARIDRRLTGNLTGHSFHFSASPRLWYHSLEGSRTPPPRADRRGTEDRPGPPAVPQARPRKGEEQPFQVHQPRGDDRQEGERPGVDPHSADQPAAVPLREEELRRRRRRSGPAGPAAHAAAGRGRRPAGRRFSRAGTSSKSI